MAKQQRAPKTRSQRRSATNRSPTGTRARSRPRYRREIIVVEAVRLFREKGFAGTTLNDIADAVGIVTSALYRHFPSKTHIFFELLSRSQDRLERSFAEARAQNSRPFDVIEAIVRAAIVQHRESGNVLAHLREAMNSVPRPMLDAMLERQAMIDRQWAELFREAKPNISSDQARALVQVVGGVM